jgi:hypothetical protein
MINISSQAKLKNNYSIVDLKDIKMHSEDKIEWKKLYTYKIHRTDV